MSMSRRTALWQMGLGSASLLLASKPGWAGAKAGAADLQALAEEIRKKPRAQILDLAAERMRRGVDFETMLGAVFLAGLHEIEPWYVGGKLHAVLMVASIFDLADTATPEEAWLGTLWNLDDFKRSQERDLVGGDWVMPPKPAVSFPDETSARREFLAAMDAWDTERADRALVGLTPFHTRDSLFEIIWPLAVRCYENIGHKIIYAAQVERTLRRMGWRYAEPALRSLVLGLLYNAPGQTSAFARSRELAASFPEGWRRGKEDPQKSLSLLGQIRPANAEEAQRLVIAALKEGLGPQTIWDGLRLFASELFQRHPETATMRDRAILLPVHALTVTNACGYASRMTRNENTRRILLLQAAAFLASMREDLKRIVQLSMEGPGIDQLGVELAGANPTLEQCFADYSAGAARVALDRNPSLAPAFRARMRTALFHKGVEHHQHKYAAAAWEESLLVDPRWQSRILAPAATYLNPHEADTELFTRSRQVWRSLNP